MASFARTLRQSLCAGAIALAAWPSLAAVDVQGVKFPDTYQLANQTLKLNGAGVRVKVIIDVYAAGLYVPKQDAVAANLVNQAGAKSMEIVLLRDLTGQDFAEAMTKGFKANNTAEDVARLKPKLEEIEKLMVAFGPVKKGTVIHIDFIPGTGTRVLVDGKQKGPDIAGDDFQQAILRIWLGNKPVDSDLKQALLGGK